MNRIRRSKFSYFITPFLVLICLLEVFALIDLRAKIQKVEYNIGRLEKEKTSAIRERKILMAKRASVLSVKEVQAMGVERGGLYFPDRRKVFYVSRESQGEVYSISIRGSSKINEPKGGSP